jgi:23S rRNA G2069 N7-methylase RlmK/C1962 C5-methylase RlmI
MKLLSTDGKLIFSNNKRDFVLSKQLSERYHIKDITAKTIPEDIRDQRAHRCFEIWN